ncbi:hypothetical protein K469DRAFT_696495 [Zopfia rhizophila CBS 207.26]|uniref:Uncharacterized protein n=1 Tax=Zopfia rhizophila CBS 207.26 TaxID=1314779 RepID=A0A6A6DE22_9PEZI|nr:hypothetical protein K469DRAFT_696495 [Zopfia rhizophila CBS 207.26]
MDSAVEESNSLATVSHELAQSYLQNIEDFVNKGDTTYIEITSFNRTSIPDKGERQPLRVLRLLICPLNSDIYPGHPFPDTSYETLEKVLRLEKNYLSFERLQTPSVSFEVPLENDLIGFVMKAGKWDGDATDFSLSGVFNPKAMHSNCILRILVKKDLEVFKKRLYELRQLAWYPLFLPAILIEMRIQELPHILTRIRRFLYRVEKTTGTHKNYLRRLGLTKSTGRSLQDVWNDPDFEIAPAELTSIASDCTYYDLMAQRDNALNKRTSDASLEVSRFSKMDSNDMRTIAAVTLGFLPATFMATLFSTGFFDFHKNGQVVSSWIWLYWLFTVLLTIFVYFGWYWYSWRKRQTLEQDRKV